MTYQELDEWFTETLQHDLIFDKDFGIVAKIEALKKRVSELENKAPVLIEGNTYQAIVEEISYDGKSWHFNNQIFQNAYIKLKDMTPLYPAALRIGYLKNGNAVEKIEINVEDKIIFTYQEDKLRSIKLFRTEPVFE